MCGTRCRWPICATERTRPRLTARPGSATMPAMYEPGGGARRWAVRRVCAALALAVIAAFATASAQAADLPVVRVGVLKFGTVAWELDVMRRHGLDRAHGIDVEPLEL